MTVESKEFFRLERRISARMVVIFILFISFPSPHNIPQMGVPHLTFKTRGKVTIYIFEKPPPFPFPKPQSRILIHLDVQNKRKITSTSNFVKIYTKPRQRRGIQLLNYKLNLSNDVPSHLKASSCSLVKWLKRQMAPKLHSWLL